MGMAHSVEGRFPFLDHRVVDFCSRLPSRLKLRALNEKHLLKMAARKLVPPEICRRPKRPYRAPIHKSFFESGSADYIPELLCSEALHSTGLFKADAVAGLVRKIQQKLPVSESEDMALAGIISTQLLHHQFIDKFQRAPVLRETDQVKTCRL